MASDGWGPLDGVRIQEVDRPEPQAGEIRVRVHASAVNPADLKVVTGKGKFLHAKAFPLVVGYDFSGTVDAVGDGVTEPSPGQEVFGHLYYGATTRSGAFAEHLVTPADAVAVKPEGVPHAVAAAAATVGLTALQALRDIGRLPDGGRAFVIGASGGVGSLAVGIARRLGAASVTGVCSTHALDLVRELGADEVVDRTAQDPLAGGGPYDVVLDAADAHSFRATRRLLGPRGAYVTTLPSMRLLTGFLTSLLSARRCNFVFVRSRRDDLALLGGWLADGLQVPIDSTYPVRDLVAALQRMDRGGMRGRVAIEVIDRF